ncbi:TPA: glycosyltransferase [Vibrio cholerae]|nr:glycosyltransferase [Vibrio cholerae]
MEKVQILLATFNGGKFLKNQLLSLQQQTYENIEIIIRDDGSKDDTIDIIKNFCNSDSRFVFIDDKMKLGVARSFQKLCSYSDAKYLMFCDQDDIWFERKVESMLIFSQTFFDDNIECLSYCNSTFYDSDKGIDLKERVIKYYPEKLSQLIFFNGGIQGCSLMLNDKLAKTFQKYSRDFYLHDDIVTLISASLGKIKYLDKELMLYRRHSKNVTGKKNNARNIIGKLRDILINPYPIYSRVHFNEKREFYQEFNSRLSQEQKKVFEDFFLTVSIGRLRRALIIIKGGYSLGNSKLHLIGRVLLKRKIIE